MGFEQPPGNWGGSGAAPARASGAAAETPVIPEGIGARPAGQRQSQAAGAQGQGQGAARSAGGVQLSDLQSILSNMNGNLKANVTLILIFGQSQLIGITS